MNQRIPRDYPRHQPLDLWIDGTIRSMDAGVDNDGALVVQRVGGGFKCDSKGLTPPKCGSSESNPPPDRNLRPEGPGGAPDRRESGPYRPWLNSTSGYPKRPEPGRSSASAG